MSTKTNKTNKTTKPTVAPEDRVSALTGLATEGAIAVMLKPQLLSTVRGLVHQLSVYGRQAPYKRATKTGDRATAFHVVVWKDVQNGKSIGSRFHSAHLGRATAGDAVKGNDHLELVTEKWMQENGFAPELMNDLVFTKSDYQNLVAYCAADADNFVLGSRSFAGDGEASPAVTLDLVEGAFDYVCEGIWKSLTTKGDDAVMVEQAGKLRRELLVAGSFARSPNPLAEANCIRTLRCEAQNTVALLEWKATERALRSKAYNAANMLRGLLERGVSAGEDIAAKLATECEEHTVALNAMGVEIDLDLGSYN